MQSCRATQRPRVAAVGRVQRADVQLAFDLVAEDAMTGAVSFEATGNRFTADLMRGRGLTNQQTTR